MKKKYVVCLFAFSLTFTCISPTGTIVYASEMGSSSQQEEEKSVETMKQLDRMVILQKHLTD